MSKCLIIGGGIAGLTAGIYALSCGYDVTIIESNNKPGGQCTTWDKEGYKIDACIKYLVGSSEKSNIHKIWKMIGAIDDNTIFKNPEIILTYHYNDTDINIYNNLGKLKSHLLEISPEDKNNINTLIKDIKKMIGLDFPLMNIKGLRIRNNQKENINMLGLMLKVKKMKMLMSISTKEYLNMFLHKGIKAALQSILNEDSSALSLITKLAYYVSGDSMFPTGGSETLINKVVDTYHSWQGFINYNEKVLNIVKESDRATKVITDKAEYEIDKLIIATDTLNLQSYFDFDIRENNNMIKHMLDNTPLLSSTLVNIGVNTDLSDLPETFIIDCKDDIYIMNAKVNRLIIHNYSSDDYFCPSGKGLLQVTLIDNSYDEWLRCKENGIYNQEKQKLADMIIKEITYKYNQIQNKVDMIDVSTPVSFSRYYNTIKGSYMSIIRKDNNIHMYPSKLISELSNVYVAGQRLMPSSGLPGSAISGRAAVMHMCNDDNKVFFGDYL